MNQEQNTSQHHQIIKDDEIDLIALVKTIWDGRKTIYYSIGMAVIIGLIIAFTTPAKYTASATLLPSTEKKGGSFGNLGALAGMAGINLGSMMGDASGIPAEIYPQVVNSYPFLKEMINQKFHFKEYEQPISVYDYVVADTIESVGSTIAKYSIRLPWTIKEALSSEKEVIELSDFGVLNLSVEELLAMEMIEELLVIEVNNKTGLISVAAEAREPVLTAQFVQKAVVLLQDYVTKYKTKQSREKLNFVLARFDEKKQEYENAQKAFFEYKDKHRNIVSERMDVKFQQLRDEYDMVSAVYKGLSTQLEQAKIAVMEETPAFTILEPVMVPIEKSEPKKKTIMIVSVFLGGFLGLGLIFGRLVWAKVKANF